MDTKITSLIIFVFVFCFSSADAQTQNNVQGDRQALIDFYHSTDGKNWHVNSGWLDGNPSNSWYGVKVDEQGRVVKLDLFDNGLKGVLPETIGNLTKVRYFNIKGNLMVGVIPLSIGNMESLEWLILAGNPELNGRILKEPPEDFKYGYHPGKMDKATNDFSGSIPKTIGNLKQMKRFELSGTSISRLPEEIGNCTALEGLYLSWNTNLNQEFPVNFTNLFNLRHLYMLNSGLKGTLPVELSNLTKLTWINLGSESERNSKGKGVNSLSGSLPDFSQYKELRSLVLDRNEFEGNWPHYWNSGNFAHLNTLRATWNNFIGTLHGFEKLPRIRSFDLTGNKLTGELPKTITSISQGVIIIGLGWNNLSGRLPVTGWPDFYQLRLVYLNNNNFTGPIPEDFIRKVDNDELKWLYLQNNRFTSMDPFIFANLKGKKLKEINISGNELSFEEHIQPALKKLSHINFIY